MRRSSWLVSSCVLLAARAVMAQPGVVAREVGALLDSVVAVGRRQDTAAFRRLATSDFVFVHSTGRVNDVLGYLAFMAQAPDSIRALDPPQYRDYGDVVYVLTHSATFVRGRGWTEFRATDLVRREGGRWRWAAHQSTALPGTPAFVRVSGDVLDAYAGRYASAAGEVRTVTRDGDRLLVTGASGRPTGYRPLTESAFHIEAGVAFIVFGRDAAGRVDRFELLQQEAATRFVRLDGR